ncbi:MAG: hypothetical protein ACLSGI_09685, partial [Butyricicoccaceae bacterium]
RRHYPQVCGNNRINAHSAFYDTRARTTVLALEIRRDRDIPPSGIYSALYNQIEKVGKATGIPLG